MVTLVPCVFPIPSILSSCPGTNQPIPEPLPIQVYPDTSKGRTRGQGQQPGSAKEVTDVVIRFKGSTGTKRGGKARPSAKLDPWLGLRTRWGSLVIVVLTA